MRSNLESKAGCSERVLLLVVNLLSLYKLGTLPSGELSACEDVKTCYTSVEAKTVHLCCKLSHF